MGKTNKPRVSDTCDGVLSKWAIEATQKAKKHENAARRHKWYNMFFTTSLTSITATVTALSAVSGTQQVETKDQVIFFIVSGLSAVATVLIEISRQKDSSATKGKHLRTANDYENLALFIEENRAYGEQGNEDVLRFARGLMTRASSNAPLLSNAENISQKNLEIHSIVPNDLFNKTRIVEEVSWFPGAVEQGMA